jgi:hypothetical protein
MTERLVASTVMNSPHSVSDSVQLIHSVTVWHAEVARHILLDTYLAGNINKVATNIPFSLSALCF